VEWLLPIDQRVILIVGLTVIVIVVVVLVRVLTAKTRFQYLIVHPKWNGSQIHPTMKKNRKIPYLTIFDSSNFLLLADDKAKEPT